MRTCACPRTASTSSPVSKAWSSTEGSSSMQLETIGRAPRLCRSCGAEFVPNSNRQYLCHPTCGKDVCAREECGEPLSRNAERFCSRECYWVAKTMAPLACRACGGQIPRRRSRKAVYCSDACRDATASQVRQRACGETLIDANGYMRVRTSDGWPLQHRAVFAAAIGRALREDEHVHHKNGIKTDNRLENLELCLVGSSAHPPGQRVADLVAWAREIIERYGDLSEPQR